MKPIKNIQVKRYILATLCSITLLVGIDARATSREGSIAKLLEEQHPSFSMSFSKNILDFFDAEIDWEDSKKQVEGDFTKGNFYVFNEDVSINQVKDLFKRQGYHFIKIEGKENKEGELLMYVNKKGKQVDDAHFIMLSNNKLVVISIYGDIRVNEKK